MPCSRQLGLVHLRQAHLADRGGGLQLVQLASAACVQPRRFMPSAIAPLDTITTSRPCAASAASWRHQLPIASASTPRPSLVTRLEPTLTTMRRASRTRTAASAIGRLRSSVVEALVGQLRLHAALRRGHMVVDRAAPAARGPRASAPRSRTPAPSSASAGRSPRRAASRSSAGTMSSLFSTSQRGLACSVGVVLLQLGDDGPRLRHRVDAVVERRQVDHVQQQARALQVAQELVAQARAFGGAFDQARNVGDDEALLRARRARRPGSGAAW